MPESKIIPWSEMVEFHKKSQELLLASIDLYESLADDPNTDESQRIAIRKRIQSYKLFYLGINTSGA